MELLAVMIIGFIASLIYIVYADYRNGKLKEYTYLADELPNLYKQQPRGVAGPAGDKHGEELSELLLMIDQDNFKAMQAAAYLLVLAACHPVAPTAIADLDEMIHSMPWVAISNRSFIRSIILEMTANYGLVVPEARALFAKFCLKLLEYAVRNTTSHRELIAEYEEDLRKMFDALKPINATRLEVADDGSEDEIDAYEHFLSLLKSKDAEGG